MKAIVLVGAVMVGLGLFAVAAYANPPIPKSAFQDWGLLIAVAGAAAAAAGAWRTMGRIEGKVERWGERLSDHSDKLEVHHQVLANLATLPDQLTAVRESIQELKVALESRGLDG